MRGSTFRIYQIGSLEVRTTQLKFGQEKVGAIFSSRCSVDDWFWLTKQRSLGYSRIFHRIVVCWFLLLLNITSFSASDSVGFPWLGVYAPVATQVPLSGSSNVTPPMQRKRRSSRNARLDGWIIIFQPQGFTVKSVKSSNWGLQSNWVGIMVRDADMRSSPGEHSSNWRCWGVHWACGWTFAIWKAATPFLPGLQAFWPKPFPALWCPHVPPIASKHIKNITIHRCTQPSLPINCCPRPMSSPGQSKRMWSWWNSFLTARGRWLWTPEIWKIATPWRSSSSSDLSKKSNLALLLTVQWCTSEFCIVAMFLRSLLFWRSKVSSSAGPKNNSRLFTADCSAAATIGALSGIQAQGGNMPVSLSVRKQFLGKLANPIHIMLKHLNTRLETPKWIDSTWFN